MNLRLSLLIIITATVFAIFINIPKLSFNFPLKLGLDLKGGIQMILLTDMGKIDPKDYESALESAREVIEKRVNLFGVTEAVVQTSKVSGDRRILVELPGLKDASSAAKLVGRTAQLDFRELPATASGQSTDSAIPLLFTPTGLTGADLKKAQVTFGSGQGSAAGPQVAIEFTQEGSEKFAQITKKNLGKPLAIFLDDQLVSAPVVQQEIVGGSAVITGQFTTQEARDLSIQLNAGALPVPIKIIEQRFIGPTLGAESVKNSFIAGAIGLSVVVIYMGLYYGVLGMVADFALLIYALLVLAIFKSGFFILPPVTLTLAGIAGFILSVGMAVDANILIFERIKEEIRWGKSKTMAMELGFKRAWVSIWASNVSSLITAAILYYFGTSLVRGFAITLSIGVLVSIFTAYVVTRTFLRLIIRT